MLTTPRAHTHTALHRLAEYMAREPERKRAKLQEQERRIQAAQIREPVPARFEDVEYMEKHEETLRALPADVLAGMASRGAGNRDPDPISASVLPRNGAGPSSSSSPAVGKPAANSAPSMTSRLAGW